MKREELHMKKFLQKQLKNEKGLTLVELLAVIVILGIIAAIAIPSIGGIIENSRIKAAKADALNAISAANLYFAENDQKDDVLLSLLESEGYMKDLGTLKNPGEAKVTNPGKGSENAITATATYKVGETVTFDSATVKNINNSGNSKAVTATSGSE